MDREEKLKLYFEGLKKIFPEIDLALVHSLYSGDQPSSGKIFFSGMSNAFKKIFDLKEKQTIIHYTSLHKMLCILEDQSFRLYNCLNLNDPREIDSAVNSFNIEMTEEKIRAFKQNFFIGSFCEYDEKLRNDGFDQWRLYGDSGKGAGLVFEIENLQDNWENVFIGNIFYHGFKNCPEAFQKFIKFHQAFDKKYKLFENTTNLLPLISLYFKDDQWEVEKEFRLFTFCPFDEYDLKNSDHLERNNYLTSSIQHTYNPEKGNVAYLKLPLNIEKTFEDVKQKFLKCNALEYAEEYFASIPHLKLKTIVLGYNVPQETFNSIFHLLQFHNKKYNFEITCGYSSLKKSLDKKNN